MTSIVPAEAAMSARLRLHNQVAAMLVITGTVATLTTGFVSLAANRLMSGRPIALWVSCDSLRRREC